jgi:ATP-dependent RNA helicase DDX31/DBP7
MGHLAKAFALRDAPKSVKSAGGTQAPRKKDGHKIRSHGPNVEEKVDYAKAWNSGHAEKRMQAIVRAQGRLTKKGGVMASTGASEFQISGGYDLEKLVGKPR